MLLSEVPGYTVKAHIDVHVIYACFGGYDKLEYQLFHHQHKLAWFCIWLSAVVYVQTSLQYSTILGERNSVVIRLIVELLASAKINFTQTSARTWTKELNPNKTSLFGADNELASLGGRRNYERIFWDLNPWEIIEKRNEGLVSYLQTFLSLNYNNNG